MAISIKIEESGKQLSARGGLALFREVLDQLGLAKTLGPSLPTYKIATNASSYDKFEALVLGLAAGADCLDEMDRLALDPGFEAATGPLVSARRYGDYLRSFTPLMRKNLQLSLIHQSLRLRSALGLLKDSFTLKLDSTNHEQHGEKMEGLAFNYKGDWGLDSLLAFDELGFQYWIDVREGATFTSNGAPEVIHQVFKEIPKNISRFALADSGFCNTAFFDACANARVKFACAMRALMYWPLLSQITHWKPTKKVVFHDGRECEVASTLYQKRGREVLRVVVLRALRPEEQQNTLFHDSRYDYCGFVTNLGEHEMKSEDVVLWYRKRADVENFIKEIKSGFDLKHLPCQSLDANKTYGLMAAFAQNIVRYMAFIESPQLPHFAKVLRFRVLMLPVQVVMHARSVSFRFMSHHKQEVERWLKEIKHQFGYVGTQSQAAPPAL